MPCACGRKKIRNKKRQLCGMCYMRAYRAGTLSDKKQPGRVWTAKQVIRLDQLIMDGKKAREIAAEMGRTRVSVESAVKRFDLFLRKNDGAGVRRRLVRLMRGGEFNRFTLAQKVGRSRPTVREYVIELIGHSIRVDWLRAGKYDVAALIEKANSIPLPEDERDDTREGEGIKRLAVLRGQGPPGGCQEDSDSDGPARGRRARGHARQGPDTDSTLLHQATPDPGAA